LPSLSEDYLKRLLLTPEQATTIRLIGECCARQESRRLRHPRLMKALSEAALVESAGASHRLEGVAVPPTRLTLLMRRRTAPRNRSERKLAGYRDALDWIHGSPRRRSLSPGDILELHRLVHGHLPEGGGRWKRDGAGAPAAGPPKEVEALASGFNRAVRLGTEPLLIVPLAVLDFLCLRPFRRGNDRVGRLLTGLLLHGAGYDVGRFFSLERVLERTGMDYRRALEASSGRWRSGLHDARPWTEYFWSVLLAAYRGFEERAGTLGAGRGAKSSRVRRVVEARAGTFGIMEIERDCPGVSRETIRLVLRDMKTRNLLETVGRGRGTRWRKR